MLCVFSFFFITLKPRVESYKSLRALNTSPPRNRHGQSDMLCECSGEGDGVLCAARVQGYLAHKKTPPPRTNIGP